MFICKVFFSFIFSILLQIIMDPAERYLDALLELLSDDSASNDDDDETHQDIASPRPQDSNPDLPLNPDPPPLRRRSSSSLQSYRSSSSAARQRTNGSHCLFCVISCNQSNFEEHLNSSPRCFNLYKNKLKVKTINGVMVYTFFCFYCNARPNSNLKLHLQESRFCFAMYSARFNVDTVR